MTPAVNLKRNGRRFCSDRRWFYTGNLFIEFPPARIARENCFVKKAGKGQTFHTCYCFLNCRCPTSLLKFRAIIKTKTSQEILSAKDNTNSKKDTRNSEVFNGIPPPDITFSTN